MDRLESLNVFVHVVDSGGFAPAGRALRRSPAMVAKHIDALEALLGTQLVRRTTRRLFLTEAGLAYYQRARAILAEFEEANREAAAQQISPKGSLRIALPAAFDAVISPILADFAAENPGVSLDLLADDRTLDMLEQRIDLAIRGGTLPDSSLIARKLAALSVIVCASPDYINRRGAPTSPEDLPEHDCIAYTERLSGDVWTFTDPDADEIKVQFERVRHRANSAEGQRALAMRGLGLIRIPEPLVRDDIAAGRLLRVLERRTEAKRWLYAVYPPGQSLPLATRRLIDMLQSRLTSL